jgi:hypothetical protein
MNPQQIEKLETLEKMEERLAKNHPGWNHWNGIFLGVARAPTSWQGRCPKIQAATIAAAGSEWEWIWWLDCYR